jgi:hypothetical protein
MNSDWTHASSICKSYGFDFATIGSVLEANAVQGMLLQHQELAGEWLHIGGTTLVPKSLTEWYWYNSDSKISYPIPWGPGQPDNAGNIEWCLSLGPKNFYRFNDLPCNNFRQKFICEKKQKIY